MTHEAPVYGTLVVKKDLTEDWENPVVKILYRGKEYPINPVNLAAIGLLQNGDAVPFFFGTLDVTVDIQTLQRKRAKRGT